MNNLDNMHKKRKRKNEKTEKSNNINYVGNEETIDDKEIEELSKIEIKEHLSDDFKNNLLKKMIEEYEKDDDQYITNTIIKNNSENVGNEMIKKPKAKRRIFIRRLAIAFSFLIIISSVTFGKNFTSFIEHLFSNQDKSVDLAIKDGYYQNIDMDYIVNDGVGIKVDYVFSDDTCIYVAINVLADEEFESVYLGTFEFKDENGNIIYKSGVNDNEFYCTMKEKKINTRNSILLFKIYGIDKDTDNIAKIKGLVTNIYEIILEEKEDRIKKIQNNWSYSFNITKNINNNLKLFALDDIENIIEKYEIKYSNYRLKVYLEFNDKYFGKDILKRNDIFIEDGDKKYYSNDVFLLEKNSLKVNFPLENNNLNNLNLIIKYSDENGIEQKIKILLNLVESGQN